MLNRSNSLSKLQVRHLGELVGPTCTVITAAVVKIHTKMAEEYSFKYSKLFGILCVIYDRTTRTCTLKMFSPGYYEVIFRMRLKPSFLQCRKYLNPYFVYFVYKNMSIGFSFADLEDVSLFEQAIEIYMKTASENQHFICTRKVGS